MSFISIVDSLHPIVDEYTDIDIFVMNETVQDIDTILVKMSEVTDRKETRANKINQSFCEPIQLRSPFPLSILKSSLGIVNNVTIFVWLGSLHHIR